MMVFVRLFLLKQLLTVLIALSKKEVGFPTFPLKNLLENELRKALSH